MSMRGVRAQGGAAGPAAAGLVVLVGALAGCSGSGSHTAAGTGGAGPGSGTAAATSAATATPAGTSAASAAPAATSTAGSGAGGAPAGPAATKAITAAYTDLFSSTSTTARSEAALQHGTAFHQTLVEQSKSSYAQSSGVRLSAISVRGPVADVTFAITSNGKPLLSDIKGFAVQESGRWKVAATTFCSLLKLQGNPPAACNNPSITALPQ